QQKPLILFDLVSTLTDAGPRYAKAFKEACEDAGQTPPAEEDILAALGEKNLKEITDYFTDLKDESLVKKFMETCNDNCDGLLNDKDWKEHLFPGVRDTLEKLKKNHTLGIYTGTRENAMAAQLQYHGIKKHFDPAYLRGKDNNRDKWVKSDVLKREQIESLAAQYRQGQGILARVIVVGDSVADMKAAKHLGLDFIGFAPTEKKRKKLAAAGAKNIATRFDTIPALAARILAAPQSKKAPKPPAAS
ncbi:MAG: HAD hydrolase-like protein, partial [Alphaproteobacteria bacterium]|nr:HAD hydrolase-like protein [Alphaproteobacteria bacterium]